jgi:hypothetical protein
MAVCSATAEANASRERWLRVSGVGFLGLVIAGMVGCTGAGEGASPGTVTGNEQGGKVPYAEGGLQSAMNGAQAHCRQFGKKARIVQMTPAEEGGGVIGFQCR